MSDHDFVEEQERSLQSLCIRTMALPVGRGAISFQTANPLPTEPITIPRLCLSGKAPPRGTYNLYCKRTCVVSIFFDR